MNYAYLLLLAVTLGLVGQCWANGGIENHPWYGVHAVTYPDHSGPCPCDTKDRVGIHPSVASVCEASESSESKEDPGSVSVPVHYGKAARTKELGCKLGLLPVSVCVSLPPNTPLKLSKHVVQRMVYSLMKDSEHKGYESPKKPCGKPKKPCSTPKHSHSAEETYKKPCEHKQPCSCSVETYDPPKKHFSYGASAEVRHVPKNAPKSYSYHGSAEAVYGHKKPCEHKQPCSCSAESYEQPKKSYSYPATSSGESHVAKSYAHSKPSHGYPATASAEYNKPCEHKKPCSCSAESYEKPGYGYTKKPVSASGETGGYPKPLKSVYGVHGQSSAESADYGTKKEGHGFTYNVASSVESYGPPKHAYKPPQKVPYHPTQKPEVPCYKSTTPAPHPTGYIKACPTAHPVPCTATHAPPPPPPSYHPYTESPRYPSHQTSPPCKYAHPVYNHKDNAPTYPTTSVQQKYHYNNNHGY
ncbi:uncharacterized protein LOC126576824 [Anopheles aquasalis]|uniref:uncharacterized protein LOC126576824 n=1 Tax=Anopheles aquasalis TaxID=42839 RepID=UPI00215B1DF9|nr:uncharacterized protein LOC126576824 [Anopheles aquasalis]